MFLENGFNLIIKMQGVAVTISNVAKTSTADVKMAKSNASRKLEFIDDTTYDGNELVVSKKDLDGQLYPKPEVGDLITSTILGTNYVTNVVEQIAMGNVIGYRLKVS